MAERERRRTENGVGIRSADGWTWLCDLCNRTVRIGMAQDSGLDVQATLDAMDAAHWCWKRGPR